MSSDGKQPYLEAGSDSLPLANAGNQMMFLGIVVLEIPFNLILQKLGPRKWISTQVVIFGLIATLQVLVNDRK